MQSIASRYPTAFSGWLIALGHAIGTRTQVAIIGDPQEAQFDRFREVLDSRYLPLLTQAGGQPEAEAVPHLLQGRTKIDDRVTAYLCQGFVCNKPTNDLEDFLEQLEQTLSQ
jgi:uncharacterized protein YyaL (SSP411 family)